MEPGEIGLPEPSIRSYASVADVVRDFANWRSQASPLIATNWEFQYPILHPSCEWVRCYLYEAAFEFDMTRSTNERGAIVCSGYKSKSGIKPPYMFSSYLSCAVQACLGNPRNEFDQAVSRISRDTHADFFEELMDLLEQEDTANQTDVRSYVLLGGFNWLWIERCILRDMRNWIGKPLCDEHFRNVRLICDSPTLFFTFRKLVLCSSLPTSQSFRAQGQTL